ncbi:MAG: HAD family hydrolase, partial [Spirochaetaceae bacterium]|nr:HAD family hydrolase [Spirochaetaceae bacterium]
MIQAVLFDLGGVLHTSAPSQEKEQSFAAEALRVLAENGMDLAASPDDFLAVLNRQAKEYKKHSELDCKELAPSRVWSEFFLKDFAVPEEKLIPCAERLCYLFDAKRKELLPRPNLRETVRELKGMGLKLGVISNILSAAFVRERLALYGVADSMDCVMTSVETGIRKPDKRIFLAGAAGLGVPASDCAYIGDRISRDVIGSRKAGFGLVMLIRWDESEKKDAHLALPENEPDFRIDDLKE